MSGHSGLRHIDLQVRFKRFSTNLQFSIVEMEAKQLSHVKAAHLLYRSITLLFVRGLYIVPSQIFSICSSFLVIVLSPQYLLLCLVWLVFCQFHIPLVSNVTHSSYSQRFLLILIPNLTKYIHDSYMFCHLYDHIGFANGLTSPILNHDVETS